jgi:hypothetical protein
MPPLLLDGVTALPMATSCSTASAASAAAEGGTPNALRKWTGTVWTKVTVTAGLAVVAGAADAAAAATDVAFAAAGVPDPHSLQQRFRRPCSQIALPPHSLQ